MIPGITGQFFPEKNQATHLLCLNYFSPGLDGEAKERDYRPLEGRKSLQSIFLIEIFIDMTVNSQAVVRNNTQQSFVPSVQFPTMVTFHKTRA